MVCAGGLTYRVNSIAALLADPEYAWSWFHFIFARTFECECESHRPMHLMVVCDNFKTVSVTSGRLLVRLERGDHIDVLVVICSQTYQCVSLQ